MSRRVVRVVLFILGALILIACGADDAHPPPADTTVTTPRAELGITSFWATKDVVTTGGSAMLTAVFSGGSGSIDNGVGDVTAGVAASTPALNATTTFTLTVKAADGRTLTRTLTVKIAPAPTITSFAAAKSPLTAGNATTLVAIFEGGVGAVDHGMGTVNSGVSTATGTLASDTTYALTVTNEAGDSVTATAKVLVVAPPSITSFAPGKSPLTKGATTELTATFYGGVGTVDQGIGTIASGVATQTGTLTASTTYTLTVTNVAGDSVVGTATVDAVDAPQIGSFVADASLVEIGTAAALTATFSGGVGSIDHGIGAVASNVKTSTGVLSAPTTFTLTVTNAAGDSVTSDVTVKVGPFIESFTAPTSKISRYSSTTLTAVFGGGTATIDRGVGATSSGVATPTSKLSEKTSFTLTVTSPAGNIATATTVVDMKKEMLVANWFESNILVFDEDAPTDGIGLLKRKISGANTQLDWPSSLQVVGDELFVSDRTRILVFDVEADGDVAPKRTIGSWAASASHLPGIAVVGGEIFVNSYPDTVDVFAVGDAGPVAPKRSLSGSTTLIKGAIGLGVDSGELFVANGQSVGPGIVGLTVYSATASGDVAPTRSTNVYAPRNVLFNGEELIVVGPSTITTMNKSSFAKVREIDLSSPGTPSPWACVILGSDLACTGWGYQQPISFWPLSTNGKVAATRMFYSNWLTHPAGICLH